MFLKGKPLDEYKGFSYRLVKVAIEKGIEDTRELADALYENAECKKAITIRKTQKKKCGCPLRFAGCLPQRSVPQSHRQSFPLRLSRCTQHIA